MATTTEPFCNNVDLSVAVHSSMTNDPIKNVTASVILTKDESQQTVAEGAITDENENLKIPITQNGHYDYVVKVEGNGCVAARESMLFDIAKCRDCVPTMLVPLSPLLPAGALRLTMIWGEKPLDLAVYAQKKNRNTEAILYLQK